MGHDELGQVYAEHYRQVYLYALSLTHDPARAEELCSDTFYKALLSLDRADGPVKFWLLRVCKNLFIDGWRRARHTQPLNEALPGGEDVLDALIRQEETRRLYRCLLRLPPADTELLYMFYFYDQSAAEIGALLGLGAGAVKTRLHRARRRLHTLMTQEETP